MPKRRRASLLHNAPDEHAIVWHGEHRSKKGRERDYNQIKFHNLYRKKKEALRLKNLTRDPTALLWHKKIR